MKAGTAGETVDFLVVATVLSSPLVLAFFGYGQPVAQIMVHLMRNVAGVASSLGG